MSSDRVKTRVLIISDTHGAVTRERDSFGPNELDKARSASAITGFRNPLPEADVVIHCGDLSMRGRPEEIERTFSMLRELRAPLKLVIAGNHDLSLDASYAANEKMQEEAANSWKIVRAAEVQGVKYLHEGTHTFCLDNGACLKVYSSEWTPRYGYWAFQYADGHDFNIPPGMDFAMTHGPPRDILDGAGRVDPEPAGCSHLFSAVSQAKPRVHCFGHIHEAWGSYLARWKQSPAGTAAKEAISSEESKTIMDLQRFWPHDGESDQVRKKKMAALDEFSKTGVSVDLTEGDTKLETGAQTLFVNAAVMDIGYHPVQCPWLIDIDLPRVEKEIS